MHLHTHNVLVFPIMKLCFVISERHITAEKEEGRKSRRDELELQMERASGDKGREER